MKEGQQLVDMIFIEKVYLVIGTFTVLSKIISCPNSAAQPGIGFTGLSSLFFINSPSFMITSICSTAMVLISSSGSPSMTSRSALFPSSRVPGDIIYPEGSGTILTGCCRTHGIHFTDSRLLQMRTILQLLSLHKESSES